MKVRFVYSKAQEIEKLVNLHAEYQWFLEQKFPIYLPKFYDKIYRDTKGNKKLFAKILAREFSKIYRREDYIVETDRVKHNWFRVDNQFFEILKDLGLKLQNKYICHVSLYGPQGQFRYPNIVSLRARTKNDINYANETIAHEILHLAIFNKAKQIKLSYQQIEGVVDLFFKETKIKNIFPNYKLQDSVTHNKVLLKRMLST